ncbi:MAG: hypothetical protein K2G63_02145 [Oscillospiraceae bacterium]|nr:hypothetical protein [Oscillospiraceae bacterium]
MKNQKFTQFLSCATLFAVMTSFTACGDSNEKGEKNNRKPQTADKVLNNVYSAETINFPENVDDIKDISSITYSEADDVYYCRAYIGNNYENIIYSISPDFATFTKIDLKLDEKKESYVQYMNVLNNGGIGLFISETSYGDLPIVDYSDETIDWDTFDWAPYEEAREQAYVYKIYDKSGQMVSSLNLDYQSQEQYDYISGGCALADGSYVIMSESQGLIKFDDKGKSTVLGKVEGLNWVDAMGLDSENNLILSGYGESNYTFIKYDIDSKSVAEKYEYNGNMYSNGSFVKGTGDYSFFVIGNDEVSGYNKNTKTFEEVINLTDSDLSGVGSIAVNKDMEFVVCERSYSSSSSTTLSKLKKADPSEFANQQVINIGMLYLDRNMSSKITDFNKKNKDYRLKIIDYSKYDNEENEYNGSIQQLNNDLLTGNAPDIIMSSNLNMDSLANKGVFADLYQFIDKDEELSRDSFLPNILSINEYDGKLYNLGTSFSLQTIAGKTKYVGDKQNWTIDDMISAYENRSKKDMKLSINNYKSSAFMTCFYLNLNSNIDYKTKTFNYDKAELVKLLEFVNQFEDEPNWEDEAVAEANNKEWEDYQVSMIKDKYLLQEAGIYDFRSYHELVAGTFANEPITLVGFPTADGSGVRFSWNSNSFSIVSNSACKDACWSFIREFFLEDYQTVSETGDSNIWAFPVNQKAFDKLAEQSKSPRFWIDPETGKKNEYETTFWAGDKEVKIGDVTDEEIAQIKELINSVKTSMGSYDSGLYDICNEESQAFFKGDKTAEETADIIINRISIYIAEKG